MGCAGIVVQRIERKAILQGLAHKPAIFTGVPALYGLLCLLKNAPLDSVNLFVSGGDALPDKIRMAFALLYGRKICSGYGLTETSPLLTSDFDDLLIPTNSVGLPFIDVAIAIRDEKGTELPRNTIGQIWTSGPQIMLGYYNAPEATQKVIRDGWFDTGDLGYLDDTSKLVITGRIKDLIIHKGFNIYPQEIENVILSHPNVLQVGVVGQSDPDVGQVPVAFVRLRKRQEGIEQALKQLCMQHLAVYKIPRSFVCDTKELPTTATGKVNKKVLRSQLSQK